MRLNTIREYPLQKIHLAVLAWMIFLITMVISLKKTISLYRNLIDGIEKSLTTYELLNKLKNNIYEKTEESILVDKYLNDFAGLFLDKDFIDLYAITNSSTMTRIL